MSPAINEFCSYDNEDTIAALYRKDDGKWWEFPCQPSAFDSKWRLAPSEYKSTLDLYSANPGFPLFLPNLKRLGKLQETRNEFQEK